MQHSRACARYRALRASSLNDREAKMSGECSDRRTHVEVLLFGRKEAVDSIFPYTLVCLTNAISAWMC
jgi:hypothetical protein